MSNFYYDSAGIYRCVVCDAPFSPGHSIRQHPTIVNQLLLKFCKAEGERLETGMEMLYSCQQSDPPELSNLLR